MFFERNLKHFVSFIFTIIVFCHSAISQANVPQNTTTTKWPRSFVKDNTTFTLGYGMLQLEAFVWAQHNNYVGLQGDAKGSYTGVVSAGVDYHRRDNYTVGLHYSNFSSKTGTWLDSRNDLHYFNLNIHQLTLKMNYGWFNHKDMNGMLYSGFSLSYRVINKEVVYPYLVYVADPEPYPYIFSNFSYNLTPLGYKGRFGRDSKVGFHAELGLGNMGVLNCGLNYTL